MKKELKKRYKKILCIGAVIILCWVLFMGIDCFRLINAIDSGSLEKPFVTVSEKEEKAFFDVIYGDIEKIKYVSLGYSVEYEYLKGSYIWEEGSGSERYIGKENIGIYSAGIRLFDKILIWDCNRK